MSRWCCFALSMVLCLIATDVRSDSGVQQLVEVIDITGIAVSPGGTQIAFRTEQASLARNRHQVTWYVAERGRPKSVRRIADGGEGIWVAPGLVHAEPAIWSPDGRFIYYRALIDGEIQIWRASSNGESIKRVSSDAANIKSFHLSEDGTSIVYKVGATREDILRAEQAEYDSGVLIDHRIDPGQNLFHAAYIDGRLASERLSGAWFDREGLLADAPIIVKQFDLHVPAAMPKIIRRQAPKVQSIPDVATWGTKELHATMGERRATYRSKGDVASLVASIPGKADRVCVAEICRLGNIVAIAWQAEHDSLILTTSDSNRRNALHRWDFASNDVSMIHQSAGTLTSGGKGGPASPCAISANDAFCVEAGPAMPPRLVQIDLESGAFTVLADPNAVLGLHATTVVENIEWRDAKGRTFTGQLFRLREMPERPSPLFITYYQCAGYVRGGTGDEWPLESLAQAGIVSLCINSAKLDIEQVSDPAVRYDLGLSAVESAISMLSKSGMVDARRVGMGGFSFGSEVAFWVAMKSNLLRTISTASPQITPTYYWLHGLPGRDNHENLKRAWGLGAPDVTIAAWHQQSPVFAIESLKLPILMQLPEHEFRSQIELLSKLGEANMPAEMYVFPDEPHHKIQPRHKYAAYQRNLDWFRFWLQDYEDQDSAKTTQYARWRHLRLLQCKLDQATSHACEAGS